jgi:uncharacterized protein
MPQSSAELVDAYRMARAGSSRRGEIALSRMSRLAPLLCNDQGVARFELDFHLDSQSRPLVTGRIQAKLELICQRCLEPLVLELDLELRLGIVRSDEEAVALRDTREPLTLESGTVSLSALVEDELILGLPAAPLHPAGSCRPPAEVPADAEAGGERRFPDLGEAFGRRKKPKE